MEQQWQAVEREAPERVAVPSGNRLALAYEEGRPPVLAVRIQEMFGQAETPRVRGARVLIRVREIVTGAGTDDLSAPRLGWALRVM